MGRPTKEELELAIRKAIKLREKGEDTDFVGKALLNHHYRLTKAENVISAIHHYLRSGNSTIEHARLIKALENWDKMESDDAEHASFGLD
ncbi:MAG: hypothetical protein H7A00_02375 [Hahellaceae bacterium]|nr:hypothetical protein [Hahellaceae bacterium]